MIIKGNDTILRLMSESLAIYDQALYYQRQRYFETKEQNKIKTYSYNELYNIIYIRLLNNPNLIDIF